jgi:putative ABC transport system permease protein
MTLALAAELALKEMLRNRGRVVSIGAVIALITVLILFLAGLGEGLGLGNRQYVAGIDADLLVYQETADLQIAASQFDRSTLAAVRRAPGVADVGAIAFASTVIEGDGTEDLRVSFIGVEPGRPGAPPLVEGPGFGSSSANEAILGRQAALRSGARVGDLITVRSTQGAVDERYTLRVVGISTGQQYQIAPSVLVPLLAFDRIRPRATSAYDASELTFNLIAVETTRAAAPEAVAAAIEREARSVQAVDKVTAYRSIPGYEAQQSTVDTQTYFTLVIGILVVGGFFQIQTLQKLGQIGMLKAIGAANPMIALATVLQILFTNLIGVGVGGLGTAALGATFPATVPIVFDGGNVLIAVAGLLIIGPLGGLVALRAALRVEPLAALGLAK